MSCEMRERQRERQAGIQLDTDQQRRETHSKRQRQREAEDQEKEGDPTTEASSPNWQMKANSCGQFSEAIHPEEGSCPM